MAAQKLCHICRTPLVFKEGQGLRRYRCRPCQNDYVATVRRLKNDNPLPQDHSCACCGKSANDIPDSHTNRGAGPPKVIAKFCLDHDHATGQFRGWLCVKCNQALGLMQDNTDTLRNAIAYLEETKRQPLRLQRNAQNGETVQAAKDCPVCISAITKCMFCP